MRRPGDDSKDRFVADEPTLRRLRRRIERHWKWGRAQGFGRLIEEDQLDPVLRAAAALDKWRWRRTHPVARGEAIPVFLVGVQRSGTNMVVRGLERSPAFEVHNENDRRAFSRFELRDDDVVRELVRSSRHRYVLFKPLCDSHRVADLLERIPVSSPGRAIWAYRAVDGRVRSALAKFGDVNRRVLSEIASGAGRQRWQAKGLSPQSLALIRSFDYETLSPASGAALFWYVRNALYFELALHERPDVTLVSYDALVAAPEPTMRALCAFLGLAYEPSLIDHISARSTAGNFRLELDPRIRAACDELQQRLDQAARDKARQHKGR